MATTSNSDAGSDGVYARILQRIERDELHKHCRHAARRDAKCVRDSLSQLHDALHRLRVVDSAAKQLRHKHAHRSPSDAARNERLKAQLREIKALRAQLGASLDALGQPSPVKDRGVRCSTCAVVSLHAVRDASVTRRGRSHHTDQPCLQMHKDLDWESRQHIKASSDAAVTKAEPRLKSCSLDPSAQVKQEVITSAATCIETKPALQHSGESAAVYKSARAALSSAERSMQPVVTLELELDDADASARAPTCLDDAQRLAHASLETQSFQFPFLVAKVQSYLSARALLDAAETREITQALEITASISVTIASRAPSEPALSELLRTIDKFYALAGAHAVCVATANMTKFVASWRLHAPAPDARHRTPLAAQEGDDAVIRIDV